MKTLVILVLMVFFVGPGCRLTAFPLHSSKPSGRTVTRNPSILRPAESSLRPATSFESAKSIEIVTYDQSESANDGVTISATSFENTHTNLRTSVNNLAAKDTITLADLQSLAMENNPTIKALAASTQKAAGFRTQVGLAPNPTIGYQAVQLGDQGTDQHTFFLERQFVRGGKLEVNKRVLNEAIRSQNFEWQTQQIRVLTDIETKFYEVLASQRRVELLNEISLVVEKGAELSETRFQGNEGSRIDVLQAKIQKNEVDLAKQQAAIHLTVAWKELVTISGIPEMEQAHVIGDFPEANEELNWDLLAVEIISTSPEMQAALARVAQARENLNRQRIQAVPNITGQIAAGVDNGTNSGLLNLQVGVPLTVNNRNQGNILAAQAEYCRLVNEAERIELAIRARLAAISREYDSSLAAVRQFTEEILPNAVESLNLADISYKAGESSFVQVLVARRTFFDSNINSLEAKLKLAQAKASVEGFALSGALDLTFDESGDDSLRDQSLDQQ